LIISFNGSKSIPAKYAKSSGSAEKTRVITV
jgi:hypothetical protein